MSKIYVVGGGPSLTHINLKLLKDETTIGVNKTIFHLPSPSYFITMDYTVIAKLTLEKVKALSCPRFFVANLSTPYLQVRRGAICDTRTGRIYQDIFECFDSVLLSRKEEGIGTSLRDFRCGNNSGYCAFQLAVALGYTEIYFLGIDLNVDGGHTHFHQGYKEAYSSFSRKLPNYTKIFVQGIEELRRKLPEVRVYSCSSISSLNSHIPYTPFEETLWE